MKNFRRNIIIVLAAFLSISALFLQAFADGTQTCLSCGYAENKTDWKFCNMCGAGLHVHSWGDWVIVVEATLEEEGEELRTCQICNMQEKRFISMISVTVGDFSDYSVGSK